MYSSYTDLMLSINTGSNVDNLDIRESQKKRDSIILLDFSKRQIQFPMSKSKFHDTKQYFVSLCETIPCLVLYFVDSENNSCIYMNKCRIMTSQSYTEAIKTIFKSLDLKINVLEMHKFKYFN